MGFCFLLIEGTIVHAAGQHECDLCKKKFKTKQSVLLHKNGVHNGEKAFICNVCGKGFTQKSTLVYHKIAHDPDTFEKNIKCEVCDKVFFREKIMKHYMKVHRTPSIP